MCSGVIICLKIHDQSQVLESEYYVIIVTSRKIGRLKGTKNDNEIVHFYTFQSVFKRDCWFIEVFWPVGIEKSLYIY